MINLAKRLMFYQNIGLNNMLFGAFFIIVGLSVSKAQIFVEDFQLSKSPDVTHLRVEYHTSNNALDNDSLTYSLWKGKNIN